MSTMIPRIIVQIDPQINALAAFQRQSWNQWSCSTNNHEIIIKNIQVGMSLISAWISMFFAQTPTNVCEIHVTVSISTFLAWI